MNPKEFIKAIEKTYQENLEITRKKNADYSGDKHDAFSNFRNSEVVGVSVERAILVRMMDKISRVSNLLDKKAQVKETLGETLADLCNYAAILKAYIEND